MRTIEIIDIASFGLGKAGKGFWLLSEQRQLEMEERFGLLMGLIDSVKSGAK